MASVSGACGGESALVQGQRFVDRASDAGLVGAYVAYLARGSPGRCATFAEFVGVSVGLEVVGLDRGSILEWSSGQLAVAAGGGSGASSTVPGSGGMGGVGTVCSEVGGDGDGLGEVCTGGDGGVVRDAGVCVGSESGEVEAEGMVRCIVGEKMVRVSAKTLANRAKRHRKRDAKIRKKKQAGLGQKEDQPVSEPEPSGGLVPEWRRGASSRGFFSGLGSSERDQLVRSRAGRLKAENELKEARAKRQLEMLKAEDVEQLKKSRATRLLRQAECDKVRIEKAYVSLAKTGNVPGVGGSVSGGGSAKTVVSGSSSPSSSNLASGTISPNSSVSMKEVHDMQKELETLRLERVQHLELMEKAGVKVPRKSQSMSTGWTTDGHGDFAEHHLVDGRDALPDAYVVCKDGRIHSNYFGEHDFDDY